VIDRLTDPKFVIQTDEEIVTLDLADAEEVGSIEELIEDYQFVWHNNELKAEEVPRVLSVLSSENSELAKYLWKT